MIEATADVDAMVDLAITTRLNFVRPESDLVPWTSGSVVPDEAPLLNGVPTLAPLWVRADPLVSSTGEFVRTNRPAPTDVVMSSQARFIAGLQYWDDVTNKWSPHHSEMLDWFWTTDTPPVLSELVYRNGKEQISRFAFTLDDGDFFASSFNAGVDDAVSYTIALVLSVRQGDGDEVILDTGTLAGPDTQPIRVVLSAGETINYQWGNASGSVDQVVPVSRYSPFFLVMVVSPPQVTVYYSAGSKYLISSTANSTVQTTDLQFLLGKSASFDDRLGAAMNVFEFNFWATALSQSDVIDAVSKLSSTYGEPYGQS